MKSFTWTMKQLTILLPTRQFISITSFWQIGHKLSNASLHLLWSSAFTTTMHSSVVEPGLDRGKAALVCDAKCWKLLVLSFSNGIEAFPEFCSWVVWWVHIVLCTWWNSFNSGCDFHYKLSWSGVQSVRYNSMCKCVQDSWVFINSTIVITNIRDRIMKMRISIWCWTCRCNLHFDNVWCSIRALRIIGRITRINLTKSVIHWQVLWLVHIMYFFCKWKNVETPSLLQTGTVATKRKSLWPRASSLSLLKRRYSGSSVATSQRCPLLLCLIVATDVLTSFAHRYLNPQ
jgi:hypothetical protein